MDRRSEVRRVLADGIHVHVYARTGSVDVVDACVQGGPVERRILAVRTADPEPRDLQAGAAVGETWKRHRREMHGLCTHSRARVRVPRLRRRRVRARVLALLRAPPALRARGTYGRRSKEYSVVRGPAYSG